MQVLKTSVPAKAGARTLSSARRVAGTRVVARNAAARRTSAKHVTQAVSSPQRTISEHKYIDKVPDSLLREGTDDTSDTKVRMERIIREGQDMICKAIEEIDGTSFHQDAWVRDEGGGGISRVLADGNVWEKAGVNVSVVYGTMPPEAYRAAKGSDVQVPPDAPRVPFFACGISSVMHPRNPHCPTMHFNYRYFETEEWCGIPPQSWFGGGTDITPSYLDKDDMKHFHGTYKDICDKYDSSWYPRFKEWCDDYFVIKHRGETRGCGGIFYDDLNEKPDDTLLSFAKDNLQGVIDAYLPIVRKHKDDAYTEQEKRWQQVRRGRYVEFNLVYDRGTIFGLKTGGRIESILMSMPLTSRWEYDMKVEPGTPEAEIMDVFKNPKSYNWV